MMGVDAVSIDATLLKWISDGRVRLSKVSEPLRRRVIGLGMQEPPLVDTDGDWVTLTPEGRQRLAGETTP